MKQLFRSEPTLPVRVFEHQVLKRPPPQAFHILWENIAAHRRKLARKAAFLQCTRQLHAAARCNAAAAGNVRLFCQIRPQFLSELAPFFQRVAIVQFVSLSPGTMFVYVVLNSTDGCGVCRCSRFARADQKIPAARSLPYQDFPDDFPEQVIFGLHTANPPDSLHIAVDQHNRNMAVPALKKLRACRRVDITEDNQPGKPVRFPRLFYNPGRDRNGFPALIGKFLSSNL